MIIFSAPCSKIDKKRAWLLSIPFDLVLNDFGALTADTAGEATGGTFGPEISTDDFLTDLFARRGKLYVGHEVEWQLEQWGAALVEPTAFEPDPGTYHGDYYYNAVTNILYKKVIVRQEPGIIVAYWQPAIN